MSADDPYRNGLESQQREQRSVGVVSRSGMDGVDAYQVEGVMEGVGNGAEMRIKMHADKPTQKRFDSGHEARTSSGEQSGVGPRRQASVEVGGKTYRVWTTATPEQLDEIVQMVEQRAFQVGGRRGVTEESVVLASVALAHELSKEKARAEWLGQRLEVAKQGQQVTERSIVRLGERVASVEEQNERLREQSARVRSLLEAMLDRVERALDQVHGAGALARGQEQGGELHDVEDGED